MGLHALSILIDMAATIVAFSIFGKAFETVTQIYSNTNFRGRKNCLYLFSETEIDKVSIIIIKPKLDYFAFERLEPEN